MFSLIINIFYYVTFFPVENFFFFNFINYIFFENNDDAITVLIGFSLIFFFIGLFKSIQSSNILTILVSLEIIIFSSILLNLCYINHTDFSFGYGYILYFVLLSLIISESVLGLCLLLLIFRDLKSINIIHVSRITG